MNKRKIRISDRVNNSEKMNIIFRRIFFAFLILIVNLIQNTGHMFPSILGVRAFLIIPLVICISMFERIIPAAMFGLFAGVLWDITLSVGDGFYALFLTLCCTVCSVLISYLMRNNLSTAALLCSGVLIVYILTHWLCFLVFRGVEGSALTFLTFYLPSALYSLAFLPLDYVIIRIFIKKLKNKYPEKIGSFRP